MKFLLSSVLVFFMSLALVSCEDGDGSGTPSPSGDSNRSDAFSSVTGGSSGGPTPGQGTTNPGEAGKVTAGEWNDLENWDFWQDLMDDQEMFAEASKWGLDVNGRIDVAVQDFRSKPVANVPVTLVGRGRTLFTATTDNEGIARLYTDLTSLTGVTLRAGGQTRAGTILTSDRGVNRFKVSTFSGPSPDVELAFVVDATGSMGDELEYLKKDLQSVIERIRANDRNLDVQTATVFYRDEGDEYVTRHSNFTDDIRSTMSFIKEQSAGGGGDWPEAVHSALDVAIHDLTWSPKGTSRILFLLLDAPPHEETQVLDQYRELVEDAAARGIRIVPVTASGIDRAAEFLMRLTAMYTNGTYVFITDDSGIGNDHLEPTVGDYDVELLNDLLVRLVGEFSE